MMRKLFMLAIAALLAYFYYTHRTPDDWISGHVFVVDGDSIDVLDRRVELFGIDAPEVRQTCIDADGAEYRCGETAANTLTDIIGDLPVRCEPKQRDEHGRAIARCFLGDHDLAAVMVANGHALADRALSADYIDEEDVARTMKRGMWQGSFTPPREWREKSGQNP